MADERESQRSGWPLGLGLALATMISISLGVLAIAITNPDAQVESHPLATAGASPRSAH